MPDPVPYGDRENQPEPLSPFWLLPCTCVGIPLDAVGQRFSGSVQVLVFKSCDSDASGPELGCWVCEFERDAVARAMRLSQGETRRLLAQLHATLVAGHQAFELSMTLNLISKCLTNHRANAQADPEEHRGEAQAP